MQLAVVTVLVLGGAILAYLDAAAGVERKAAEEAVAVAVTLADSADVRKVVQSPNPSSRLQPFAEVSIRVLDAAGRPARGLSAAVVTESASDRWMFPVLVDSDGRAFARYLVPGGAKVTVYDGWQQRFEQAVVLSPGLNPEVVVQLPVKEPPR